MRFVGVALAVVVAGLVLGHRDQVDEAAPGILAGKAVVFVETACGRFGFTADTSGTLSANADLGPAGSLRLR